MAFIENLLASHFKSSNIPIDKLFPIFSLPRLDENHPYPETYRLLSYIGYRITDAYLHGLSGLYEL